MRLSLVLSLLLLAGPAAAETWKPVPGEPDTYVDIDFLKVDQQSGLVIVRTAMGKPSAAGYAEWSDKTPIAVSAIDCKADTFKDLGLDFEGDSPLPDNWRSRKTQPGMKYAVGQAGLDACKQRETLPKVALP